MGSLRGNISILFVRSAQCAATFLCPPTRWRLHKWFQRRSPLTVLPGIPRVKESVMYVFSRWPLMLLTSSQRDREGGEKKNSFRTHAQVFALTLRARFMCRWFASSIRVYRAERREVAHQVEAETKSFYLSLLEICFSIFLNQDTKFNLLLPSWDAKYNKNKKKQNTVNTLWGKGLQLSS